MSTDLPSTPISTLTAISCSRVLSLTFMRMVFVYFRLFYLTVWKRKAPTACSRSSDKCQRLSISSPDFNRHWFMIPKIGILSFVFIHCVCVCVFFFSFFRTILISFLFFRVLLFTWYQIIKSSGMLYTCMCVYTAVERTMCVVLVLYLSIYLSILLCLSYNYQHHYHTWQTCVCLQ